MNIERQTVVEVVENILVSDLSLNPDRADVIIPAVRIYLNAMKWSGARQIYVPKIGLSDGIVKAMYYKKI